MNKKNIKRKIKAENDETIKPLLKLKPKFNLFVVLANKYLVGIFAVILIASLIVSSETYIIPSQYVYLGVLLYVLYVIVMIFIKKNRCLKTVYLFFEDHIYIRKKYGKHEEVIIPYSDIDDILFYQTYPEKFFEMGSLGVKIKSGSFFNRIIMLESVPELQKNIDRISKFINLE